MSSILCQVSCTFLPSPHGFQNGTQYSLALPPPPPTPAEIPPILSTLVSPFQLVPGFRPFFSGTFTFEYIQCILACAARFAQPTSILQRLYTADLLQPCRPDIRWWLEFSTVWSGKVQTFVLRRNRKRNV